MPPMLATLSTLNSKSTFNISADTIKAIKPTEVIEPTVTAVAPTKAAKATDATPEEEEAMSLDQLLNQGYEKDPIPHRVLKLLAQGANYSKDLTIADCSVVNKKLHYRGLLYIFDYHVLQLCLCKLHHDTPVAGHLEIRNIYELLHRSYYWPNMQGFVRRYVRHCHVCKRSKSS